MLPSENFSHFLNRVYALFFPVETILGNGAEDETENERMIAGLVLSEVSEPQAAWVLVYAIIGALVTREVWKEFRKQDTMPIGIPIPADQGLLK